VQKDGLLPLLRRLTHLNKNFTQNLRKAAAEATLTILCLVP
jgi:hypothetical protein